MGRAFSTTVRFDPARMANNGLHLSVSPQVNPVLGLMRKTYFDAVNWTEPSSALFDAGATPDQVKEAIVALLDAYVPNKSRLLELAVTVLATEAVCIGQLSSRREWKEIVDSCFEIRNNAIRINRQQSFEVIGYFEPAIRSAQESYALLVIFEVRKDELTLDEFAFDLIRTIGTLIESNLQPYIKELYCLQAVAAGQSLDPRSVAAEDFGNICEKFEKALSGGSLLTPAPWGVRVNQWRNIAHHHSYVVSGDQVIATYGKTTPKKEVALVRAELLALAQELVMRLGALKSSRVITAVNHIDELEPYLPKGEPSAYRHATALAASFATQGFRLLDLQVRGGQATAIIEDVVPTEGNERPIHCSQFVGTIASRFPGLPVEVRYIVTGRHAWTFSASAEDLEQIMSHSNPLEKIAHIVTFKNEP